MKKTTLLLILIVTNVLSAQNIEFTKDNFKTNIEGLKEAKNSIKSGDEYYKEGLPIVDEVINGNQDMIRIVAGQMSLALKHYLDAYKFNPNNAELNYKIGVCYVYSKYKTKAQEHLEKAFALDPKVDSDVYYYLGRGYHLNMEWDKAVKAYDTYKKKLNENTQPEKLGDVDKKIEECKNGRELVKKPVRVFIDNMGPKINSSSPDYGPVISADESVIIFTSRREGSTGNKLDEATNMFFEDIYMSTYQDGNWTPAENLGKPINTEGHDANLGLSPDGQKLYVYKDDNGNGNIYESLLKGSNWQKPGKLNKNINTEGHESSASISFDGKRLFFVSDKPEGVGYRDIYMAKSDGKGGWAKAINLGPIINTPYGEEAIFAHPDGKTIYFSSQGHNTMGGYDIFKAVYENGKWQKPENLGYPINTPDDDVFFVISGSGKHGYYSSIKPEGYGEKDIYKITFLGPEKPVVLNNEDNLLASIAEPVKEAVIAAAVEIKTAKITILKGVVTDNVTKKPLEATIEIVDNELNEVIASFNSNSNTGKYLVSLPSGKNYGIAVKAENYLFHSENFDIPATAEYQEVSKDIALKSLVVGSKIVLNNIFFDYGKATLRKESTTELERLTKLLNDIPTLRIEISGHTDNKGSVELNQALSQARAKSVVDYLITKGVKQDRLEFKGYGFEQPVASNDTEEGRQLNRRTEFKVLSK